MTKEVLEHQTEAVAVNKDDKKIKVDIPLELIKNAHSLIKEQKPSKIGKISARQTVISALEGFIESKAIIKNLEIQIKDKEKIVALYEIKDMNVEAKKLLKKASSTNEQALEMMEEIKLMQQKEQK
jgi:hypothetical protein